MRILGQFLGIFALFFALFFSACASYPQIILPDFNERIFSIKDGKNAYALYVSHENGAYHFALFDALGAPVADKILQDSRLKNAKFLPPSARFDEVFIESLRILERGESSANVGIFEIILLESSADFSDKKGVK